MKIFVGSTNPVKVNAVTQAASETWPEVKVMGFEVESGVSSQPMSDEETKQGAIHRAQNALAAGMVSQEISGGNSGPDSLAVPTFLGVGMEGGVVNQSNGEMWSTVWAAVVDQTGEVFLSAGARFQVPEKVAQLIREKVEMGHAVAEIIGEKDRNRIKQNTGLIGIMTDGFIDRTEEYQSIIKLALGIWYGRETRKKIL